MFFYRLIHTCKFTYQLVINKVMRRPGNHHPLILVKKLSRHFKTRGNARKTWVFINLVPGPVIPNIFRR